VDETSAGIERLYRERYIRFRNGVAPLTGSYDTARDVVQEGFARALRARNQYRAEGSLEGWVWRIVLRTALEERAGRESLPVDAIERDPALADAIRALPPRRRLVVFLRYFADLPYATIADVLRIDEGTVAATLAQARQALAKILEEEGVRS
jgi:RNA polymerase sigma-70 factor (ECF subfamily)